MLLYVPRQLGGDVGHEVAAGPEAVVVPTHPELTMLQGVTGSQDRWWLCELLPVSG
jgi:hypothetical protein